MTEQVELQDFPFEEARAILEAWYFVCGETKEAPSVEDLRISAAAMIEAAQRHAGWCCIMPWAGFCAVQQPDGTVRVMFAPLIGDFKPEEQAWQCILRQRER